MNEVLFFKSMAEQDTSPIVICDTKHTVVYMNPAAKERYSKRGGAALIGKSLLECHNAVSNEKIGKVLNWFSLSSSNNIVHTYFNEKENKDVYMIALRDEKGSLIGYYEKHEYRNKDSSPFYEIN